MRDLSKAPAPTLAAGGIVVRDEAQPLIGIVRLRKDKSWVLPKGKLKPGESALTAAKREVEEETGHDVTVLGFLGALSHVTNGRQKIVQFWHMRAESAPVRALMRDVKAVKWLPLNQAVDALTRPHEKVFLSNVGPTALDAAGQAGRAALAQSAAPPVHGERAAARNTVIGSIRAWLRRIGRPAVRG
jgi:8-oxo-dGTP diphosphatase